MPPLFNKSTPPFWKVSTTVAPGSPVPDTRTPLALSASLRLMRSSAATGSTVGMLGATVSTTSLAVCHWEGLPVLSTWRACTSKGPCPKLTNWVFCAASRLQLQSPVTASAVTLCVMRDKPLSSCTWTVRPGSALPETTITPAISLMLRVLSAATGSKSGLTGTASTGPVQASYRVPGLPARSTVCASTRKLALSPTCVITVSGMVTAA